MKAIEVNAIVSEAINELTWAQPGMGTGDERSARRKRGGELLVKIKGRDMAKVDDSLLEVLNRLA